MLRPSLLLMFATACSGSSFQPATLPSIAVEAAKPKLLQVPQLLLQAGEHFAFSVRFHGIAIGRVDVDVTNTQVMSKFKTNDVAGAFAMVSDETTTTLDRAGAKAASNTETLVIGGEPKTFEGGNAGQTPLSALGVLRAWARPDAQPGFLTIAAAGKIWRLDLARPTAEDLQGTHALRIDGKVQAEQPVAFVMWLAASDDRTPLRFELSNDELHVVADLVRE
jgi:hypothetical protein